MSLTQNQQNSILTCAKYAYRPNHLGYCGPDRNKELLDYLIAGESDAGLAENLQKFETLYPYLRHIARTNKEKNLFDEKIIKAYWVGNNLLEKTKNARLYEYLIDDLKLKKKFKQKEIENLSEKIPKGANAHHSFHVFNIWKRTGHIENPHTLYTMDECRIGWGKVQKIANNIIEVLYRPLVFKNYKLDFGEMTTKKVFYELGGKVEVENWISFHWSSFCDVLGKQDVAQLTYWTTINLDLANYYGKG